jgi:hypothetical protein
MATFRQALIEKVIGHKYAIDAQWLGDDSLLAWSNLGYWQGQQHNYPLACQSLADQIAASVQLVNRSCFRAGVWSRASLLHWLNHYHIKQLSAVELQKDCIQSNPKGITGGYCGSLN